MRPSILTASALTALAAAALAPAPAPAATVSPTRVRAPQLAVNADGATVVAWERLTKRAIAIEARAGDAPLELGHARRLSADGHQPQVAIGSEGTKAVIWFEEGARGMRTVRVAVARPGHNFGKGQIVDRRRANMAVVGVAVQPTGRVVAIWRRSSARLGVALARRNHAFGRPRDFAAIGQPAAGTIPVDPRDGSVIVAYGTPPSSSPPVNQQAAVRTLTLSSGSFSAPALVSLGPGSNGFSEAYPAMASGPAGVAVAYTLVGDPYALNLVRRDGDGSWAAPERIGLANYGEDVFPVGLQATLPADGSAVAAWSIDDQGSGAGSAIGSQTVASIAAPSSAFGPFGALTPAGARFGRPAVASAGNEAFVASAQPHGPVLLATRSAGAAAFAAPVALSAGGDGDVLLAAAGAHVVAAYQRGDRLQVEIVR
ncbi:MAG: hypothetical protein QOE31_701 [Solirubrobacteraceae bacterium]|nr:hypothetical protein [Solirubrobacteraceae bacterium]